MSKKFLSREAILNVKDFKTREVEVEEWGGTVLVKSLSGSERNEFEQSMIIRRGKDVQMNMKNATAKLVALSVVDEEGNRLFSDADVETLGSKSGAALSRVYTVASKLAGLSEDDMKELTENLKETPTDTSITN